MEGKAQRDGTNFMGEVDPSRHLVKILIRKLEWAKLDEMVKTWGRQKFIFHAIIPAVYPFLVKILLVKLKVPLYSVCLNLNHEKTKW